MCRVGAVGGDGMVDGVFVTAHRSGDFGDCSFGILPLGTANDFARSVGLRVDDMTACLRLIVNDPATRIDLGLLGERPFVNVVTRSEEHTSELQSLMRISYAVFCLKKKK